MNIFYAIWADAINYERIKNGGEEHWKVFTFLYMSILLSMNILSVLSVILFTFNYDITKELKKLLDDATSNDVIANFTWFIIVAFLPAMLINYFFVFHNKKYKQILSEYKFKGGKYLAIYFIFTIIFYFGFNLLKNFIL